MKLTVRRTPDYFVEFISQTTELPSGEHLTTTVEWTEDSLKKNQATITVEVTPNWVGKSEFKTGPFSSFSPIDTKMNFVFNTRKMVLNADMVETMGGKQWGLKIHKNRFSILTGNAA